MIGGKLFFGIIDTIFINLCNVIFAAFCGYVGFQVALLLASLYNNNYNLDKRKTREIAMFISGIFATLSFISIYYDPVYIFSIVVDFFNYIYESNRIQRKIY